MLLVIAGIRFEGRINVQSNPFLWLNVHKVTSGLIMTIVSQNYLTRGRPYLVVPSYLSKCLSLPESYDYMCITPVHIKLREVCDLDIVFTVMKVLNFPSSAPFFRMVQKRRQ